LSPGNADKMLMVLNDFGFGEIELTAEDFAKSDQIIQLGYPPNRIDIISL